MSGLSNKLPQHGGRVVLRRAAVCQTHAEYGVQLLTAEGVLEGSAQVMVEQGVVEFRGLELAPDWLVGVAKTLLRGAWRTRNDAGWPRRLTRWRETPQD